MIVSIVPKDDVVVLSSTDGLGDKAQRDRVRDVLLKILEPRHEHFADVLALLASRDDLLWANVYLEKRPFVVYSLGSIRESAVTMATKVPAVPQDHMDIAATVAVKGNFIEIEAIGDSDALESHDVLLLGKGLPVSVASATISCMLRDMFDVHPMVAANAGDFVAAMIAEREHVVGRVEIRDICYDSVVVSSVKCELKCLEAGELKCLA